MTTYRQLSFSAGEVTPALWGRVDQTKHITGLRKCKNMMVMRHGGVTNRPGTYFVGETKLSGAVRLIPFVFSNDQTYILEFGESYMRVIRNGVHVKDVTATITGITQANPAVVTATAHGFSNGDEIYIHSVVGMNKVNVRTYIAANVTANTFELTDLDSSAYEAYVSGGTAERIYTITSPYAAADLFDLTYTQSADIITLASTSYPIYDLARTGHAAWTFTALVTAPTTTTPTGLASDASGTSYYYVITATDAESGEESLPTSAVGSSTRTSTLTWTAVTGAVHYNIYLQQNGLDSWIGLAGGTSFKDDTYTPDPLDNPPEARTPFSGAGNYPAAVTYFQQRLIFANTNNGPETVWTSRSGLRKNFSVSTPIAADDPITFATAGNKVHSVRHLLGLGKLLSFTDSGEWVISGGTNNIISPSEIAPQQQTENGSGKLRPLVVEDSALYVQARGSTVRDIAYAFETDSYKGNELSIFAAHLFDAYTLIDWSYQQVPHSIVWVARSDGLVLAMTYVKEHQIFGWHQHDFGGVVESVATIPSGNEDSVYFVVKRTIDGVERRYIERLTSRLLTDVEDMVFVDSALSYDGTATSGTVTMSEYAGGGWDAGVTVTVTITGFFVADDVGNAIWIYDTTGDLVRVTITEYVDANTVRGRPHKDVPTTLQGIGSTTWAKAVDQLYGLWHIEGEDVSVLADGNVEANPLDDAYDIITVTSGTITLSTPAAKIHVGLPVLAELETLDIDQTNYVMTDKHKQVSRVYLQVESSRGVYAGPDATHLTELKIRNEEEYDDSIALQTGVVEIPITASWTREGKVVVHQEDPLPLTVLSLTTSGYFGPPKRSTNK